MKNFIYILITTLILFGFFTIKVEASTIQPSYFNGRVEVYEINETPEEKLIINPLSCNLLGSLEFSVNVINKTELSLFDIELSENLPTEKIFGVCKLEYNSDDINLQNLILNAEVRNSWIDSQSLSSETVSLYVSANAKNWDRINGEIIESEESETTTYKFNMNEGYEYFLIGEAKQEENNQISTQTESSFSLDQINIPQNYLFLIISCCCLLFFVAFLIFSFFRAHRERRSIDS